MKMKNKILTAIMALGLTTSVMAAGEMKVSGDSSSLINGTSGAADGRTTVNGLDDQSYDLRLQMNAAFADNWSFALRDRAGNEVLSSTQDGAGDYDATTELSEQILTLGEPGSEVSSAADAATFCSNVAASLSTGVLCGASSEAGLDNGVVITLPLEAEYVIQGGMTLTPFIATRNPSTGDGFMKVVFKSAIDEDVLCDELDAVSPISCADAVPAYAISNVLPDKAVGSSDKIFDVDVEVHFDLQGANFKTQMANTVDIIVEAEYL